MSNGDPIFEAAKKLYGDKALEKLEQLLTAQRLEDIPIEIRKAMVECVRPAYEGTFMEPVLEASDWKVILGEAKEVCLTRKDIEKILLELFKGDEEKIRKAIKEIEKEIEIPYIVTEKDMLDYIKDYIRDSIEMAKENN